jgi:ATP-dependent 26S proteasome regulatory subunit
MSESAPAAQPAVPPVLLDAVVRLIASAVQREIVLGQARGVLPRVSDRFTGTYVPEELVAAIAEPRQPDEKVQAQLAELARSIDRHYEEVIAALRGGGDRPMSPLEHLFRAFGLSSTERRTVLVLLAFEASTSLRQMMRYLVNDATRVHPDVGVVQAIVYGGNAGAERLIRELSPDGVLMRMRIVEVPGGTRGGVPLLLQPLRVTSRVFELATGLFRLAPEVSGVASLFQHDSAAPPLLVPADVQREVDMLVAAADRGAVPLLLGPDGTGRRSLVGSAAGKLTRRLLVVRSAVLPRDPDELAPVWRSLVREAALFGSVLLFEDIDHWLDHSADVTEALRWKVDSLLDETPVAVAATATEGERRLLAPRRGVASVTVPPSTEGDRRTLWDRALGDRSEQEVKDAAAARYPVTAGTIHLAAAAAFAKTTARGASNVTIADVHDGLRTVMDVKLGGLGVRIETMQTWDDLVLPEEITLELRELVARVRHRKQVYEDWGFARKVGRGLGLSALFAGPPGTGKTMVAGIMAADLGLDLYQVDLSRIVNKYVGETEKNLANLFDAAESGHAVLLFDEADSLFAKRTEVKSSVDRYANLEVNYLLQRMESFRGITILTTNHETAIDEAFRRRLSLHIAFPVPEEEERLALWRALLPKEAAVAPNLDLDTLADRFAMTGGYIRNAVLRAAFLAADAGRPIEMGDLLRAASLEYASMGKVMTTIVSRK